MMDICVLVFSTVEIYPHAILLARYSSICYSFQEAPDKPTRRGATGAMEG